MRALFVLISIGLFFTLIQYSYGIPIQSDLSLSAEEDDDVEKNVIDRSESSSKESDEIKTNTKSVAVPMDESDQSSEEKEKVAVALNSIPKSAERESDSNEQIDDTPSIIPNISNKGNLEILRDSDEE